MSSAIHVAVISADERFRKRAEPLKPLFSVELNFFNSVDEFSENNGGADSAQLKFVLLDAIHSASAGDTTGMVQVAKFVAASAGMAVVVAKKVSPEDSAFIKKSGASVVCLDHEYLENSKIEFILTRFLHGDWIPIKVADLIKDQVVDFTLFHMMPLNGRMLPVLPKGQILEIQKLKKFESVGEMYIQRHELLAYKEYAKKNNDNSAEGLGRRCRAVYTTLVETYKDLVMLLTDQSEMASFDKGRDLYTQIFSMSSELISCLASLGEPWNVVNNSSLGDFSAVDRAPALAAYAGLLSLELDIGKPEDVMVAALMADIGLLDLSYKALMPLKTNQLQSLTDEDHKIYEFHPTVSLNKALSRKVPVPEDLKQIILCTHERADGSGFPGKLNKDKIPLESYLIQVAEQLDLATLVTFGQPRLKIKEARSLLKDGILNMSKSQIPLDLTQKILNLWK